MSKKAKKTQTQSVKMLRQNFHKMFVEGHSIREISDKYSVDISYVYKMLGEIAKENEVERDFYLRQHLKSHNNSHCSYDCKNAFTHYNENDFKEISNSFNAVEKDIEVLLEKLENIKVNTNNYDYEENGQ